MLNGQPCNVFTISCTCVTGVVVITIMPPSFVSVIWNAESGETLLGPASTTCSACNAFCHCSICSTADWTESIHLMRCAVTAPSDPAANLLIFCRSSAVSAWYQPDPAFNIQACTLSQSPGLQLTLSIARWPYIRCTVVFVFSPAKFSTIHSHSLQCTSLS